MFTSDAELMKCTGTPLTHWEKRKNPSCGSDEKIYPVDSIDLYYASDYQIQSGDGCLPGGADCRFFGGDIYGDSVCGSV